MRFDDVFANISKFFSDIHAFISIVDWTAVIIVSSICLLTIMSIGICEVLYKDSKLVKHFDDKIFFKGYIRNEFYNGVRKYACRHYDKYDDDFVDKEIKTYDYFETLVFDRGTDSFCKLNRSFCNYIESHHPDYKLSDFADAIIKYRFFCESQRKQQQIKEQQLESERSYSIKCSIRDCRRDFHKRLTEFVTVSDDDIQDAYMSAVNVLRQNGFKGLMPLKITQDRYMFSNLSDAVILPHDKLFVFAEGSSRDFSSIDVEGILICYDTYSEKYYIDSSEHMLSALSGYFEFDPDDPSEYDDFFRSDVHAGHKLLVKILPLSVTGYTDINALRNDLIDLYDSTYPKGYNVRPYLIDKKIS